MAQSKAQSKAQQSNWDISVEDLKKLTDEEASFRLSEPALFWVQFCFQEQHDKQ